MFRSQSSLLTRFCQPSSLVACSSLAGRGFLSFTAVLHNAGTVRSWAPGRRFGFIVDDESQRSHFAHADDCIFANKEEPNKSIQEGERVEFQLAADNRRNDGSQRCIKVSLLGGQPLPSGPHGKPDRTLPGEDPNADKNDIVGRRDVTGTVHGISRTFGFISFKDESLKKYGAIFFHASSVMPGVTLRIGDSVVFDVVSDTRGANQNQTGAAGNKNKVRASNVSKVL